MNNHLQLFVILFLFIATYSTAQEVFYSEDFTDKGGESLTDFGWTLHNDDHITQMPYSEPWWIQSLEGSEMLATSTFFLEPGDGDRWAITPQITLGEDNASLYYNVFSNDQYLNSYEVYISTTGTDKADFENLLLSEMAPLKNEDGELELRTISLHDYLGETVYIAFRSVGINGFLLGIDNIEVKETEGFDLALINIGFQDFAVIGDNEVKTIVQNKGGTPITSFDLTWVVDDGEEHTTSFTDVNIEAENTMEVSSDQLWTITPGEHVLKVKVSHVNGELEDDNSDNDTLSTTVSSVSSEIEKKVVVEEGSGTWCGWCPRGIVTMEHMYNTEEFSNFIRVVIHKNDPMDVTEYAESSNMGITGLPGSMFNRDLLEVEVSIDKWEEVYIKQSEIVPPAYIEASGELITSTRDLTLQVNTEFEAYMHDKDLRLSVIIVEDHVTGNDSDYDQANYYSGDESWDLPEWEALPNPVPAEDMEYNRVGRALLGGFDGIQEVIPETIEEGMSIEHEFNYTIPQEFNTSNLSFVVLLIDQSDGGKIINANEIAFNDLTLAVDSREVETFSLYPNPASGSVHVDLPERLSSSKLQMNLYDMGGRLLKTEKIDESIANGSFSIDISDLVTGTYLVSFSNKVETIVKQLVVK